MGFLIRVFVCEDRNVYLEAKDVILDPNSSKHRMANPWLKALRRLSHNRVAAVSAILLVLLISIAVFGRRFSPYSPYEPDFDHVAELPSLRHWLGTDELGRDILSRIIYGAQTSLWVGFTVQIIATLTGTLVGLVSGYYGSMADVALMRLVDIIYSFPSFLLVVFTVSLLSPGIWSIVVALSFVSWPFTARLVRGQVLSLKEQEFILAARVIGASDWRILVRHSLPNTLSLIIVQFTIGIGNVIMAEAGLSFLGIGIPSPHPTWGGMIDKGREYFLSFPHMTIFPSIALGLTMLAFNFLGDGLCDALDPRFKNSSSI